MHNASQRSQENTILFLGESATDKTHTSRLALRHLLSRGSGPSLQDRFEAHLTILNAFGSVHSTSHFTCLTRAPP